MRGAMVRGASPSKPQAIGHSQPFGPVGRENPPSSGGAQRSGSSDSCGSEEGEPYSAIAWNI